MCGIAGIFDPVALAAGIDQSTPWTRCLASLARRGPDGQGTWIAPSRTAMLGHTRLSIVDLSHAGDQPMVDARHPIAIAYNGELYNAPTLRTQLETLGAVFRSRCDTEVLLHAWTHWGKGMLDRLLGMYSFVIWDDEQRSLFGAVDHAGMKPMVWKHAGGRLLIASDCDSLRALTGSTEQLYPLAIRHVLTMSCCPPPMTMWTGISKLSPGHTIEWTPGTAPRISLYYAPPEQIIQGSTIDQHAFADLWEQVVSDHLLADVPVGVFLSGGIDSAATTIAAAKALKPTAISPACFTLQMEGQASEHKDAIRLANALDLPITVERWDAIDTAMREFAHAYDEPQGYSALLTMVRIAKLGATHAKAVIAGDGGDETFGGYLWQRENGPEAWQHWHEDAKLRAMQSQFDVMVADPDADDDTRALARRVLGSYSYIHGYLSRVFPGFHPAEARAMTSSCVDPYDHETMASWLINEDRPTLPHLRRVQRLDLVGFCPASILPKVDRGAMHFGLEVRSPMLDRRLIDIGLRQSVDPRELIADGSQSRPQLRSYIEANLDEQYTKRPKQGFSVRSSSELNHWRAMSEQINQMKIVTQGVLDANWASYVPYGDMTRLRLICMLGLWAESRI